MSEKYDKLPALMLGSSAVVADRWRAMSEQDALEAIYAITSHPSFRDRSEAFGVMLSFFLGIALSLRPDLVEDGEAN